MLLGVGYKMDYDSENVVIRLRSLIGVLDTDILQESVQLLLKIIEQQERRIISLEKRTYMSQYFGVE